MSLMYRLCEPYVIFHRSQKLSVVEWFEIRESQGHHGKTAENFHDDRLIRGAIK